MPRTKQETAHQLGRNVRDASRLGPTGRNLTYIFNDPGDYYQQTVPPVQVAQGQNQWPSLERINGNLGFNPQQVLRSTLFDEMMKRQALQMQMQNFLSSVMSNRPLIRGQIGQAQFRGGPFMSPSSTGKPNIGFGVQGKIPF